MSEPEAEGRAAVPAEAETGPPAEDGWIQVTPPDEIPEPPPEIVRAARVAPEHYIFLADPNWAGEGPAPSWAVLGRWRTDTRGEIVDWEDNEEYRPSPEALGWRPAADPVDEAAQRAVTGYGPVSEVPRALARAAGISVVVDSGGAPEVATAPDGTRAIPVFTASLQDDGDGDGEEGPGLPPHRTVPVTELLDMAGAMPLLYLSPTAPVTMTIDTGTLRAAAEDRPVPEPAGSRDPAEGEPAPREPFVLPEGTVSQEY
ncbi:type VII secretion system-associated protein [Streptomyces hirsutus]|uniref:type VII secretion system-associated protein n=1 Tax=Streptomyces hirsutus TaxID=35620 RepID=UPI0033E81811